ncbi:protein serine/threonine phosphatase 2C family protein [bacterium]|nr:protein serine/threonine phosphatase 2C family protein [bacterium]
MNIKQLLFVVAFFSLTTLQAAEQTLFVQDPLSSQRTERDAAIKNMDYLPLSPGEEIKEIEEEGKYIRMSAGHDLAWRAGAAQIPHSRRRKEYYCQDFASRNFDVQNKTFFFGVFDGHGIFQGNESPRVMATRSQLDPYNLLNAGGIIAKHCSKRYPEIVHEELTKNPSEFTHHKLYDKAAHRLQFELKCNCFLNIAGGNAGTTASMVFINFETEMLATINAGDSRILILDENYNIIFSTNDHKPHSESELRRIKDLEYYKADPSLLEGVKTNKRLSGFVSGLGVARGFSDLSSRVVGHTHHPEVHTRHLSHNTFIVLASDGVWDVMSNEEVAQCVSLKNDGYSFEDIAKKIALAAAMKNSKDDITVQVIEYTPKKYDGKAIQSETTDFGFPL